MSINFFAEKNRSLLTAIFFINTLSLLSPLALSAQNNNRVDTKSLTQDLDTKDSALAQEEAQLLATLGGGKGAGVKAATKDAAKTDTSARASIDLKKVADTIAHAEAPAKATQEMAKPAELPIKKDVAPVIVKAKAIEPAPKIKIVSEPAAQPVVEVKAQPPVVKPEVIREIVKESDPQLRQEVTSMGNLFAQWQTEFEVKHAKVLAAQKKQLELAESLDARIDNIEHSKNDDNAEQKRLVLAEENQALREEKLVLASLSKEFETRLSTLEKSQPVAPKNEFGDQVKALLKDSSQIQEKLGKQEETLSSLRLADGQLKHRMNETEDQMSNAVREINSVKLSVDRIETNLTELSEQFVDSLKYRPHAVYDATAEWNEYPYDWNTPGLRYSQLPHNAAMSDMPMVTVTETNANLWSGPEEDDKIITTIRRGGQLAVESTEHDWYRVILADGRRAWIPARAVIHNNPKGRDTTLRIASAE